MAKTKPKSKPVKFDFSGPEVRDGTVAVEGYDAFAITFKVPDGESSLEAAINNAQYMDKELQTADDAKATRGDLLIRFILDHLKTWALKPDINRESLLALAKANTSVVFRIFNTITEAGADRKN